MDTLPGIKKINLHVNSFGFILNFKHGNFNAMDLLDFASDEGLSGVDIDISYGDNNILRNKSKKELELLKLHAKKLGLTIDLDISSTSKSEVHRAVDTAKILGVKRIRLYVRHHGYVSEIIKKTVIDLKLVAKLAETNNLQFLLEQHEALKSEELVRIIKAVNSSRVRLLFDFGNMINTNEKPLGALKKLLPYIQILNLSFLPNL